jgi:hypothetical protein
MSKNTTTDLFDPERMLSAEFWGSMIDSAIEREKEWRDKAELMEQIFKGLVPEYCSFNIFKANTVTLRSAIYARGAKPDITRRFGDPDPISKAVSTILERIISYSNDKEKFFEHSSNAVMDYLLGGRGVLFVCYKPVIATAVEASVGYNPITGIVEETETNLEFIDGHRCFGEYVYWQDFAMSDGRTWNDVWWVARRHYLSRTQVIELLSDQENAEEVADSLGYGAVISETEESNSKDKVYSKEEIWEIWNKITKQRVYLAKGTNKIILIEDDPYNLDKFFPCAEPMIADKISKDMTPTPFFDSYKEQARELNVITNRIKALVDALRRRGVYDAQFADDLKKLSDALDNEFVPIAGLALNGANGFASYFATEDLTPTIAVVNELMQQRASLIQSIYEISGISDILRGQSNPNETATAQRIKGSFASLRIKDMQSSIQRCLRDTYEIMAEIICELYTPEAMAEITNLQIPEQAWQPLLQVMRDSKIFNYRIDIETDSTVFEDREEAKANITEFMIAFTNAMTAAGQIVGFAPEMLNVYQEMTLAASRTFKIGRQFEESITNAFTDIAQRLQMQQQQPQPNIEQERLELDKQKAQADYEIKKTEALARLAELPIKASSSIPLPEKPELPMQ